MFRGPTDKSGTGWTLGARWREQVLAVIEFQSGGSTPRQTAQGLVRGQLQIRYEVILTSGFRIPRLTGG